MHERIRLLFKISSSDCFRRLWEISDFFLRFSKTMIKNQQFWHISESCERTHLHDVHLVDALAEPVVQPPRAPEQPEVDPSLGLGVGLLERIHVGKFQMVFNNIGLKWFRNNVQSGAAGWIKCLVTCFMEVPLTCLGSMAAAVQPKCLWNSQKICYMQKLRMLCLMRQI